MAGPLKGGGVAAKEIAGHQHFQRALFPFRARLDALDRAFLHDVEEFGRIAFTKNDISFSVVLLGQILKHALAVCAGENLEQRDMAEFIRRR